MQKLRSLGKHRKKRDQELPDQPSGEDQSSLSTPYEDSSIPSKTASLSSIFHRRRRSKSVVLDTPSQRSSTSSAAAPKDSSITPIQDTFLETPSDADATPTVPIASVSNLSALLSTPNAPTQSEPVTAAGPEPAVAPVALRTGEEYTHQKAPAVSLMPTMSRQALPSTMSSSRLSSSGHFNGLNGSDSAFSPPQSPQALYRSTGRLSSWTSSHAPSARYSTIKSKRANGAAYKIGLVQESAVALRKRSMAEMGAGVFQGISDVTYIKFLEWIRSERLTTLPHKGSRWDKVLIRALYFAEQLHRFDQAIQSFALDSGAAAAIGYGHAQLLLELGHENSEALDKAFSVFYKFALSFSSALQRSELLAATSEIREQLCLLYTDILSLVVDVAIRFYKTANGMTSGYVSLDIFDVFGDTIETFRSRQSSVVELIWAYQIENEGFEENEALDVKVLSRWLSAQDRVLATLTRDHSTFVDQQVEFTCIWFQKHLIRFIQSEKPFMLVTGQPGAGKTTLAGSIVERLQRPVNRKQFDTLFCSLSPDIPTTATSLAIVKSLLFQLLDLRVGNMATYHAIFDAYHQSRTAGDVKSYEECLWHALAEALKQPTKGGNELVMIVDGLDEIAKSESASIQASGAISPAALLDKLVSITKKGTGVRLIILSSSVKMTSTASGTHHEVVPGDVRDDLHAVALRALINNPHFKGEKSFEQEPLLDRIIQTANGSFLWTILACETLNAQRTAEALAKTVQTLETTKPSTIDLILKLFTSLDTTPSAKTLLSWILAAERPLTIDEIHTLFTVDVHHGTVSEKGINVDETLKILKPFLTVHERIVRFKHPIIHSALHTLAHQNKISIPLKESETDLLLRALTYAKFTLSDKGEPTIDNTDPTLADRLFRRHHFLEYVVRYWVLHLQQSPLAPKSSGEYNPTSELQKVFPDTTILALLEQLCWETQLPIPQAIDLHKLVGTVRRGIFTQNHPAVLQTYLAIATSYLLISNTTEAATYFFLSTKISRKVLSDIHPLTLEVANTFLRITETLSTTTRTEIVTRREEVLIIMITAYERQYGSTSELVIQTRKLLVELYASINEEEKALQIYRLIEQATVQQYGRNSHQAQDVAGHLNVVLGKGKGDRHIDAYKETFFHDENEEAAIEIFDVASVVAYLRRAQECITSKELSQAERTYVELWLEVSSKCRTSQSVEWHEKNIQVATSYAQYLKTQKRTSESSAILTTVWQQYERHQLSYSESIVSSLTVVAQEMKTVGNYTSALSIFNFASSYYKNSRQEESHSSLEIRKQLSETSTELVKQSLASSVSVTETTSTVSESVFQDVFFSVIQSSKTVDSSTIALSKKLTLQYIEKRNYSAAIKVINATLQRTWSSFFASSIHNVTMTTTFTQESIELVERLAECYLATKQFEKVEDTYSRLFRAVLITEKVDQVMFDKARTLLINYYDKHGYADHAISTFQEILVAYRARLGATHALTIQTLYIIARRCQAHPRNHPYWIEYYLQIIASLNKDSDVCHKDALDAIIVVTTTYWEDRRYAEAVTIYRVLWNTFVRQTKIHQVFSEAAFVQTLYEHYYQCLEETKASSESLFQVTKDFRETAVATFGAESTIAVEATLSLAQVAQRSEEHFATAIALYEEVSRSSKTTSTKTTITEVKQALSSLYIRQLQSSSSSSVKAESVSRALTVTQEQFTESTSKYGYSHESSLTHLKELAVLYHRQQKTEVAVQQLTRAVTEIISKETSSQKMIESAASIASTFYATETISSAYLLIEELHRQIFAKDSRSIAKWSFDLTKCGRSSLAFLASLQYNLRKDLAITFAEIMADLTMEWIYFEQFKATLTRNESLTNILLAAAPLRYFLRRNKQHDLISVVEDQAVGLFVKRDAQDLNTLSKDSPRIFIIGILDILGNGRNKNFIRSVILASNDSVAKLTQSKRFPEAYDIANLGFLYASKNDGYNGPKSISLGFKLASLLVGREGEKATDTALRKKMLELSNKIVKVILDIAQKLNINFAQVQLYELSHLSALLGEQQDYATLEWLLTTLWSTRDAQRSWPAEVLLNLGSRLIRARYLAGHSIKAIRLCEDIAYNMRRAHGPRAAITIESYELLAQLYTSTAQSYQASAVKEKTGGLAQEYFKKALGVHEDILRLLVHSVGDGDDSDDEMDAAAYLLAKEGVSVKTNSHKRDDESSGDDEESINKSTIALRHLHLLKLAYQRLGSWPKPYDEYATLNAQVFRVFGTESAWKGVQGTEKWDAKAFGAGKAESQEGGLEVINDWALGRESLVLQGHDNKHSHAHQNGGANGSTV